MSSEFPRLQKHLDKIRFEIDKLLKEEFIDKDLIEEVELDFQATSFIHRSSQCDVVLELQKILSRFEKIELKTSESEPESATPKVDKKHIFAAESLLRMSRCEKLAVKVLILGLSSSTKDVPELASKALGEIKEYRNSFNAEISFQDGCYEVGGQKFCIGQGQPPKKA